MGSCRTQSSLCVPVVVEGALSCVGGDQRGCSWVSRVCPVSPGSAPCLLGSAIPDTLPCCPPQHLSLVWVLAVLEGLCGAVGPAGALTCQGGTLYEINASGFHSWSKTVPKEASRGGQDSGDTSLGTTGCELMQGAVPRGAQLGTAPRSHHCPSHAPLQWQSASQTSSEESKISGCQLSEGSFQGSAETTGDVATIFL